MSTVMGDALQRAGFIKERYQLWAPIEAFIRAGGTELDILDVYREIAGKIRREGPDQSVPHKDHFACADATNPIQREGLARRAENGLDSPADPLNRSVNADLSQPMPGADLKKLVQTDQAVCAGARQPITSGKGQARHVHQDRSSNAPPAREPSDAYLKAAAASRQQTARTLLDVRKTSDGRLWGDVCPYELPGMKRDGAFATAALQALGALNERQKRIKLRELLTPTQIPKLFEEAA